MRHSTSVLIVLLFASLLGNVLLAVRLSRAGREAPPSPSLPAALKRHTVSDDVPALREALGAEQKKNEELQARVARLETEKRVLAQESSGAAPKPDRVAAFREKLRKMKKLMSDPALKNGAGADPDSVVELTDAMMDFMKVSAARSKEPKLYAEYLHTFYEIGLDGEGTSLTPAQSDSLTALLQGYGEELSRVLNFLKMSPRA